MKPAEELQARAAEIADRRRSPEPTELLPELRSDKPFPAGSAGPCGCDRGWIERPDGSVVRCSTCPLPASPLRRSSSAAGSKHRRRSTRWV